MAKYTKPQESDRGASVMTVFFAPTMMLERGWAANVRIEINADGMIAAITPDAGADGAERLAGPVLPGMPNCHCHAFQRVMAGLAERRGPSGDGFSSWRDAMYEVAEKLTPEDIGAIAAQLYVEMLKCGYTTVAEFHYLHNAPGGDAYADPAEISRRVLAAARRAGMAITHLPVFYRHGDFGGVGVDDRQRRFVTTAEQLMAIAGVLESVYRDDPMVRIGIAPHSLRAVSPDDLGAILAAAADSMADCPLHIHIAEQRSEVGDCIAWSGRRPVEWLLENAPVGENWCLVHATHVTPGEARAAAECGAVVGLCPTTEANLGDGLFPLADYLGAGGRFAIGSDSNVSVNMIEELRWLEYGQRLDGERRVVAASRDAPSAGASLYRSALAGGARAVGQPVGRLAPGCRADFIVLDPNHPGLIGKSGDQILDGLVFACSDNPVRDVYVGGQQAIDNGRHAQEEKILSAYAVVLKSVSH